MGTAVRICRLDELPPGRGVIVQVGRRMAWVRVWNVEGRLYAEEEAPGRPIGAVPADALGCVSGGARAFDATMVDAPSGRAVPAAPLASPRALRPRVEGDYVVIEVVEGGA